LQNKKNRPIKFLKLVKLILSDERQYYWTAIAYGLAISLLTLALPISVQVLIEAIANTALVRSVISLAVILFILLSISGLFVALQTYILEVFERRFLGRISAEITMRMTHADTKQFDRINSDDLANRFFEIDVIQHSLPVLLTGGLALIFQTFVGYLIVSFYHPFFLAFSIIHIFLMYLVWRTTDPGAVRTTLDLSRAKYETANWLELLVRHHQDFKSRSGICFAADQSDRVTKNYIKAHKAHFNYTYAQTIGFLILYALASAALLGAGGWLVIAGQLTLGQLVAAELILGAIFFGLSRFSYYLELYYRLYAALYKLSGFFELSLEEHRQQYQAIANWSPNLCFKNAQVALQNRTYLLNAEFAANTTTLVAPENIGVSNVFIDLLTHLRQLEGGYITVGDNDIDDFNPHDLREEIFTVSGSHLYESSISQFLRFGNPNLSISAMRKLLEVVHMNTTINRLDDKLDTILATNGFPMTQSEVLRLKIARALAAKPKILIFSSDCDLLRPEHRQKIFDYIATLDNTTFIYLSHRLDLEGFDNYMALDSGQTKSFSTLAGLITYTRKEHSSTYAKTDDQAGIPVND